MPDCRRPPAADGRNRSVDAAAFPFATVSQAAWLHRRFAPGFRDAGDFPAECGVSVLHEAIRSCCVKRRREGRLGEIWDADKLVVMVETCLRRDKKHSTPFG